ncbi:hypothetical protein PV350_43780 [Streptomyces sp. PA03-6a]|nr:hypothetical protein [Streptomyces sp. PA03-6a]
MIATPRRAPRTPVGKDGSELKIASMSDETAGTYWKWINELGLSQAIERGILSGFGIDNLETEDSHWTVGAEPARTCAAT